MTLPLWVEIDSLMFWGGPGPQELRKFKGFAISPDGAEGLDDGVDMRRESVERPQAHGEFDAPGYLAARTVPLSGWARADTAEELLYLRDRFTGLLAGGGLGAVSIGRESGVRGGRAGRAATPRFRVRPQNPRVGDWQLQLWFPDPRLSGDRRMFGPGTTGMPVHHKGNFAATPVIVVRGSAPGYSVWGPDGKRFIVTRALTPGNPHTIEMSTGLLRVNNTVVVGDVSQADLWSVPPGTVVPHGVTVASGAATLEVIVHDTYV